MYPYKLFVVWFVVIGKGNQPGDHKSRNGGEHHREEEDPVAHQIAQKTRSHAREHHREVHNTRSKSVVRHLVTPRSDLLHHKQREAHEAEAVAEVLHDDAPADEPHARRLEPCKQGVDPERQVEDTAQREKSAPQTSSGDVVARQKRAYEKRPRAESPVVKADLLVRKTQAPGCGIRLEEQRNDLHHEALAQSVQDDEGDIIPDVSLREKSADDLTQADKVILQRAAF